MKVLFKEKKKRKNTHTKREYGTELKIRTIKRQGTKENQQDYN